MKQKKKVPKPRNEFVTQLISRAGAGGGAHGKSKKANRRSDKVKLQKETFDKTHVFSKVFLLTSHPNRVTMMYNI